jgi:uncharacterized RDD family membrane protein YckC
VLTQPVASVADALMPTIVDAIDLDEALKGVDLDELLARVDINALLERVDVDALLQRVDVNAVVQRVDMNALLDRVDVGAVTGRIELGSVLTRSTEGLLVSLLDLVRRQVVGLDVLVRRFLSRVVRRWPETAPAGPPLLVGTDPAPAVVSGRYAGPVSRLIAFGLDIGLVLATFALGAAIFSYIARLVSGHVFARGGASDPWWIAVLVVWFFVYMWIGMAVAGRNIGKALIGLRVVAKDGSPLTERQSLLRVVTLPLSFVLVGVGLIMGIASSGHWTLHDRLAGTCVVYDWGDRPAEMPGPLSRWLARRGATDALPALR